MAEPFSFFSPHERLEIMRGAPEKAGTKMKTRFEEKVILLASSWLQQDSVFKNQRCSIRATWKARFPTFATPRNKIEVFEIRGGGGGSGREERNRSIDRNSKLLAASQFRV